jgi:hypothetical protein
MARKQLLNMLFDMMKDGELAGAHFLDMLKKHLINETSDSVIAENLQFNIPVIIKNYIPLEQYEQSVSAYIFVTLFFSTKICLS